jgi:hypothetical protein
MMVGRATPLRQDRSQAPLVVPKRLSSTKNFFAVAGTLSPNCNITRIDNADSDIHFLPGAFEATPAFFCVIASIAALFLPIRWALDSSAVIILQQI